MKTSICQARPTAAWFVLAAFLPSLCGAEVPRDEATFEIPGRCEDRDTEGLPGVRVRLFISSKPGVPPELMTETISDAEGQFHFMGLQPPVMNKQAGEYRAYAVVATKEEMVSVISHIFSASRERVLTMRKSTPVHGQVVDERGNPVADATVFISGVDGQPLPGVLSATTDANGRFILTDWHHFRSRNIHLQRRNADGDLLTFAEPKVAVRVHHDEFGTQTFLVTEFKNGVEMTLKNPAVVDGIAFDAVTRQPAADVHIYAQFARDAEHNSESQTRTDESGQFRLLLVPDVYNIWASMPGRTMVAYDSFKAVAGANRAADFKLMAGGFIEGQLLDAEDKPVRLTPNQTITIGLHGPSRPWNGAAVESVPVQPDGTYRIRVSPGENAPYVMSAGVAADRNSINVAKLPPITVQEGETVTVDIHMTTPR